MRIHSISTVLAIPFVLCAVAVWFMADHFSPYFLYYLLAPIACLVVLYIFHGNIDYWWLKKNPIPLDERLIKWLETHDSFYRSLDVERKEHYEKRVSLYLEARAFKSVGQEKRDLPEDVKILFAASAVKMSLAHEDFLIGDYDRIFVYKHPFPSPRHQFLHTVETDAEDGVIIVALDHGVQGFTKPHQYYDVILHGYAEAFVQCNSSFTYPDLQAFDTAQIEAISGFTYDQIAKTLGFEKPELLPILIVQYFHNPSRLKTIAPKVFDDLDQVFRAYPV